MMRVMWCISVGCGENICRIPPPTVFSGGVRYDDGVFRRGVVKDNKSVYVFPQQ